MIHFKLRYKNANPLLKLVIAIVFLIFITPAYATPGTPPTPDLQTYENYYETNPKDAYDYLMSFSADELEVFLTDKEALGTNRFLRALKRIEILTMVLEKGLVDPRPHFQKIKTLVDKLIKEGDIYKSIRLKLMHDSANGNLRDGFKKINGLFSGFYDLQLEFYPEFVSKLESTGLFKDYYKSSIDDGFFFSTQGAKLLEQLFSSDKLTDSITLRLFEHALNTILVGHFQDEGSNAQIYEMLDKVIILVGKGKNAQMIAQNFKLLLIRNNEATNLLSSAGDFLISSENSLYHFGSILTYPDVFQPEELELFIELLFNLELSDGHALSSNEIVVRIIHPLQKYIDNNPSEARALNTALRKVSHQQGIPLCVAE